MQVLKCNHQRLGVEKLTEGEAQMVVSTVAAKNVVEASRQLKLRSERDLQRREHRFYSRASYKSRTVSRAPLSEPRRQMKITHPKPPKPQNMDL